ncbi:uncharacterized protein TrAFT101_007067 [Trichoderma asperellum]|uniref:uncharacterized protein n=1 Tax=Trichoderma asperellum TaxID=101201 RepID=UPI003329FBF8|nr:hypothetical protein TrAFT101_007067 [Trichoderma asperellum]
MRSGKAVDADLHWQMQDVSEHVAKLAISGSTKVCICMALHAQTEFTRPRACGPKRAVFFTACSARPRPKPSERFNLLVEELEPRSRPVVKTFSNLLNSIHHPFAGARCSASGGLADSTFSK